MKTTQQTDAPSLEEKIEDARQAMYKAVEIYGMLSPETLAASQTLDALINEAMKK